MRCSKACAGFWPSRAQWPGSACLGSVAINFANIIGRYFFSVSIPWAEEIMLFLMVGCVFTGCCAVAWEGRQIRMDVVVSMLPPSLRVLLSVLSELVLIAAAAAVTSFAWPVITQLCGVRRAQPGGELPARDPAGDASDRLQLDGAARRGAAADAELRAGDRRRRTARTPKRAARMAYLIFFGLPVDPADPRLSDLSHPARDRDRRGPHRRRRADRGDPDLHVRQPRQFPAARGAVLRARRRDHGARRHRAARHRDGHGRLSAACAARSP